MSKAALDIALKELGTTEISGEAHNQRILEYHQTTSLKASLSAALSDEIPWCASFVNWCLQKAGFEGTNSARARSFLAYGQPVAINDIQAGDIVVFSRGNNPAQGHVAFFCEWRDPSHRNGGGKGTQPWLRMRLCGGNQSNTVSIATYSIDNLIGIRRPIKKSPTHHKTPTPP